jgi:hypothetical protein
VSLVLMLLALLLAVLAAANPMVPMREPAMGQVSIILDRGVTMAMPGKSDEPFRGVLKKCAERVPLAGNARVLLVPVPGPAIDLTGDTWRAAAERLPATVLRANLDQIISKQLSQSTGPIVVLSNQAIHSVNPRVMQVLPEPPIDAVAITAIAARASPHPQAMVRLENHSDWKSIHLSINSGANSVERDVALPSRGQSVDGFVDLTAAGSSLIASLTPHSKLDPWATAYLVRNPSGVQLAVDPALDDAVKRMAAVYTKDRSTGPQPLRAIVTNHELPADQPGVWINSITLSGAASATPVAIPHSVTRNVINWPEAGGAVTPPDGFEPVVSRQNRIIVAVRVSPRRQVWLNASLSDWEKTPDFVIFFGNVFDWISSSDQDYRSTAPTELGDRWTTTDGGSILPGSNPGEWPGIYRSTTGETAAVNPGEYPMIAVPNSHVDPAFTSANADGTRLQTPAIFASLVCLLGGLIFWKSGETKKQSA